MSPLFSSRSDAAEALAERLESMQLAPPVVVLALPRGGVPIGAVDARRLHGALDLVLVRKIGVPWQPELAVAAVVDGQPPDIVVDDEVQRLTGVSRDEIDAQAVIELAEIARQRRLYLRDREPIALGGATAVVVDDGIATGTSIRAALKALRQRHAARLVLAVPVAPCDVVAALRLLVDELVCLAEPHPFRAVGLHYGDFGQVSDAQVLAALEEARTRR